MSLERETDATGITTLDASLPNPYSDRKALLSCSLVQLFVCAKAVAVLSCTKITPVQDEASGAGAIFEQ